MKKLFLFTLVVSTIIFELSVWLTNGNMVEFLKILVENHFDLVTWLQVSPAPDLAVIEIGLALGLIVVLILFFIMALDKPNGYTRLEDSPRRNR